MKKLMRDFWVNESAATAIEYGLIAAGISPWRSSSWSTRSAPR
jgi:hypothetical protein